MDVSSPPLGPIVAVVSVQGLRREAECTDATTGARRISAGLHYRASPTVVAAALPPVIPAVKEEGCEEGVTSPR